MKQQFLACYIRYRRQQGDLNTKDVYLGFKSGAYPFEYWNAPPTKHDEINKGAATFMAGQHRMGWQNWCPGQPDSGDANKCNRFSADAFASDNYCWADVSCNSRSYVCEKDKPIPRAGWSVDSSYRSDHGNIIYSNMGTKWTSDKRREWIQVDMKTSYYVHRVHIIVENSNKAKSLDCRVGTSVFRQFSGNPNQRSHFTWGERCQYTDASDQHLWFICEKVVPGQFVSIQRVNGADKWDVRELNVFDHPGYV